ncbi:unnamed protein product [Ambrosiozyma monospora]|uniref:Unnamed protein product n=1 Tax=Ambrosiozyma monospora TaxID=43982 RepID=A0ACB5TM57_AMBMO|nr:unnamed protein product [Ambrosiozyma monospora]
MNFRMKGRNHCCPSRGKTFKRCYMITAWKVLSFSLLICYDDFETYLGGGFDDDQENIQPLLLQQRPEQEPHNHPQPRQNMYHLQCQQHHHHLMKTDDDPQHHSDHDLANDFAEDLGGVGEQKNEEQHVGQQRDEQQNLGKMLGVKVVR